MYCIKCGNSISNDSAFCSNCGAKIEPVGTKSETSANVQNENVMVGNNVTETLGSQENVSSQVYENATPVNAGMPANSGVPTMLREQIGKKQKKSLVPKIAVGVGIFAVIAAAVAFVSLGGADKLRAGVQVSLGNRYLEEMDYEQAIAYYEEALEIDPKSESAYLGLAETYVEMGDYESAIGILEEGIDETDSERLEEYLEEIIEEWGRRTRRICGYVYRCDVDLDPNNNDVLTDVEIVLENLDNGDTTTLSTDRDGYYDTDIIDGGEYEIFFYVDGYVEYSEEVEMVAGEYNLDVYLEPRSYTSMVGNLLIADADVDYTNNSPLADAEVHIEKLTGSNPYSASTRTDYDGYYYFDGLVMGVYALSIQQPGYVDAEQIVFVYEGQDVCYNSMLEVIPDEWAGEGLAGGMIYDAVTGYGVEGLTLNVRSGVNNTNGDILFSLHTNSDGSYLLEGMESGNYCLEIVDERSGVSEPYLGSFLNVKVLGGMDIMNQDGSVSTSMLEGQLRVVLSWGSSPNDLDSHMDIYLENDDYGHVYYGDKTFYSNDTLVVDLDLDDTTSYGPETTTIYEAMPGEYYFYVYNFSYNYDTELSESGATVMVYTENSAVPTYVFSVPQGYGYYWNVFTYNTTNGQLHPINEITY